ncbi:MAG: Vms1/Ankzf1 family peptidyl-tRNA hydrolase [Thermoplasmatales archaeon]|nr:Vms1/Ankzf1 family peptidyl-tRNA hydrolase [Thermoplasmatales archaeon]
MLADLKNIGIKGLSEVYDSESRDSYVSLYLNMESLDNKFVERRKKTCSSVLKENRELSENFEKTMQTIEEYLDKSSREKGQKGLVIFASNMHGFFRAYKLGLPVENLLIVDSSPYIRPVARLIDEYETFGLVLLDSQRAKIYVVSSGRIGYKKKKAKDIMNRHKKGGMSQARFQRLRKGAVNHFLKDVSEDVKKLFLNHDVVKIVIAGPGNAKIMLKNFLPDEIKSKIVDTIDVDFDETEGRLVSKAEEAVLKDEKETSEKNMSRLKEEILRNGLAVYGLKETGDAVRNGQIELLLISKDYKIRGWICEKCQAADAGVKNRCPYCDGRTSEVDVVEEIIEFAERADTKIEFVEDNPALKELGGVGGLLRFK